MNQKCLDGKWKLWFYRRGTVDVTTPDALAAQDVLCIDAQVPGNVELDLSESGHLPKDLFLDENILQAEAFEDYEWWYGTEFLGEAFTGKPVRLRFLGVDCFAEYWLNGRLIGTSHNAFIPAVFDVEVLAQNKLFVHICPITGQAEASKNSLFSIYHGSLIHTTELIHIRKPPHCQGWDIMPRAISAGLWRSVYLEQPDAYEFLQTAYGLLGAVSQTQVTLRFCYEINRVDAGCEIEVEGRCGKSSFYKKMPAKHRAGVVDVKLKNPLFWWPHGYGAPNLYQTQMRLMQNGAVLASAEFAVGIRTVQLLRTDTTDGTNGQFAFVVNGEEIFVKGTNWVPLDAYHSRDAVRLPRALALLKDIGCNMVRCWGGNVYEDHAFFDFCDQNGILVWQDFAMACNAYPQDETFMAELKTEAETIVRALRNHPCIALWSGDNECDQMLSLRGADPNGNVLTREVLKRVVYENDIGRPYLPSSPYFSPVVVQAADTSMLPEDHLWGPRDYFKSPYYQNSNAHFVSEIGYHGCPAPSSVRRFLSAARVWPYQNNSAWILHSSDQHNDDGRVQLMANQIEQLFGEIPKNLEDFSFASQISQAEALKFFIEHMRCQRPRRTGILWWNLLDGWPQFSDAVVDYYFEKKLAYHYIKRSQQPFCLMMDEIQNWNLTLMAANDTLNEVSGDYVVLDAETGETLRAGRFSVGKNKTTPLAAIRMPYCAHRCLLISWTANGKPGRNHYICGMPPFSLAAYRAWLLQIKD